MPIISNFPSGDSAYAKAKAAGYTGTEEEFNKALANMPGHIDNKENPHDVTVSQVGAVPVSDKGTAGGVATLGSDGKVPAGQLPAMDYDAKGSAATVQTNLDTHTSNTSNPHSVTYDQVGAAAASHTHSGSELTSAVPISKGGTGATTAAAAMTNLGGMLTDMSNAALGLVWEEGELPAGTWYSVCYGNGKFVAVATDGKVAYSTTGIDWTTATVPNVTNWHSVCFGNGKFVAVGESTEYAICSTDGINWSTAALPNTTNWYSVCYGNGKFVAVAYSGSKAAYSTDGNNWTAATLPSSAYWWAVCYGGGKFVAVAKSNMYAAYSTDGITWTEATMPTLAGWKSVCYGNGRFVAVADLSKIVAYSTDGITWTKATTPTSENRCSVCYGEGKFVVPSYDSSNIAYYSTDGINWMKSTLPFVGKKCAVCYGNGKFVAISYNSTSKTPSAVANATPSAISQLNAAGLTRMQLVSYVGTGTYGASNPSSLTFDFAPKVVLYLGSSVDNSSTLNRYTNRAMFLDSLVTNNVTGMGFSLDVNSYPSYGGKNEDGKGVHWYGAGSAANQLNSSGTTYYFLALA